MSSSIISSVPGTGENGQPVMGIQVGEDGTQVFKVKERLCACVQVAEVVTN